MNGIVWHGGMGHRIINTDDGIVCYRCGMAADASVDDDPAYQSLIPDCKGPDVTGHHWLPSAGRPFGWPAIECAYGDARVQDAALTAEGHEHGTETTCMRA